MPEIAAREWQCKPLRDMAFDFDDGVGVKRGRDISPLGWDDLVIESGVAGGDG